MSIAGTFVAATDISNWIIAVMSFFSVLLVPTIVIMVRGAVKWTRTEDKLGALVENVKELVDDKDKVHHEILEQMRVDREATDRRLRFIEEFWMQEGRKKLTGGS